jgi:hypothetical protein
LKITKDSKDIIEAKAHAWSLIIQKDPVKQMALQQCLQDFVEFAPNTNENRIMKKLIIRQDANFGNYNKILRQWDFWVREHQRADQRNVHPHWFVAQPRELREDFWRSKLNGKVSVVDNGKEVWKRNYLDQDDRDFVKRLLEGEAKKKKWELERKIKKYKRLNYTEN